MDRDALSPLHLHAVAVLLFAVGTACVAGPARAADLTVEAGTAGSITVESHAGVGLRAPEEVELGSVVIEAEPIPEPTIDELMRGFRDALARDRLLRYPGDILERQLAGGMLEVNTRYGRFCFSPMPTYLSAELTGGVNLASRCTAF
jgi:hypothetical protein